MKMVFWAKLLVLLVLFGFGASEASAQNVEVSYRSSWGETAEGALSMLDSSHIPPGTTVTATDTDTGYVFYYVWDGSNYVYQTYGYYPQNGGSGSGTGSGSGGGITIWGAYCVNAGCDPDGIVKVGPVQP